MSSTPPGLTPAAFLLLDALGFAASAVSTSSFDH
jgi:hypothetical protein